MANTFATRRHFDQNVGTRSHSGGAITRLVSFGVRRGCPVMGDSSECPFCAIIQGDAPASVVAEFGAAIAFFPKVPASAGHTIVVPREHVENFWSLTEPTSTALVRATVEVSRTVMTAVSPDGLSIIQSNGEAATQTVHHLHVHVVPRWDGDTLGPNWPEQAAANADLLDRTLAAMKAEANITSGPVRYDIADDKDRDDRRKHLELIAAVIGRMGSSSAQAKGWSITLAGAAFGVAVLKENAWPLIVLGIVGLLAFAKIDAQYLSVEKTFRDLHDDVIDNKVVPLSMDTRHLLPRSTNQSYTSWSVKWFYAPLILAGLLLLVFSLCTPHAPDAKTSVTINVPSQSTSDPPPRPPLPTEPAPPPAGSSAAVPNPAPQSSTSATVPVIPREQPGSPVAPNGP